MAVPEVIEGQALQVRSDYGSPLPMFSGPQMTQALVAYRGLQEALDKAMPDQIMELDGKKFRKKGYWRGVAVAFGISVETLEERREVTGVFKDGRENFGYVITRRATAPNGRFVTADGTCFAVEKARRFKCPHPHPSWAGKTEHFPHSSCPAFDPEFQWRTLPGDATEHNVRGHASTRAFNRAVSDLVGFGEVSAEEVEHRDEAHTSAQPTSAGSGTTPAAATAKAAAPSTDAPKPVAGPEGTGYVKDVIVSKVEKKPSRVTMEDGRTGTTFDKKAVDVAVEAQKGHLLVKAVFVESEKKGPDGKPYINLGSLELATAAPAATTAVSNEPIPFVDDGEPVGQPETIKTVRPMKAASDGRQYWIIQTGFRQYITFNEGTSIMAEEMRKAKVQALVEFVTKPRAAGGGIYHEITKFDEVSAEPAVAPAPPIEEAAPL